MAQKASELLARLADKFDIVFVTLCFLTQFGIIYSDLPRGFESGKILAFSLLLVVGIIFVTAKALFSTKSVFNNLNRSQWVLVLLGVSISLGFGILANIYSQWPQVALWGNFFRNTGLIFYGQLHILFILILVIAQRQHLVHYLNVFILALLIQLPFVLSNLINLKSFEQFYSGYYVGGSFGQNNFLAGELLSGFMISVGIYLFYKRKSIYIFSSVIFAVMILATMSRAGIIFLILIPLVALGLWKIKLSGIKIIKNIFPVALIIIVLVVTTTVIWKTDEARRLYAQGALELIIKNPLTGNGLDTFLEGSKQVALGDRNVDRVHHMFLDIAYSMGVPSALWIFMFLIVAIVASRDKRSFLFSLPILIFLITTVVHTKSAYHYVELSLFLGLWLLAYLDKDSWQYS